MDKLPPHSTAAENAVIACLLIGTETISNISRILEPGDFLQDSARLTYEAMLSLEGQGTGIDQLTVWYELINTGNLEKIGRDYLSNVIATMPGILGIPYARMVRDLSQRRLKILEAGKIAQEAYLGNIPRYRGVKIE